MSEKAFHVQRRMFYANGNHIAFAPIADIRSHKAWMVDEGVGHLYNKVIRGYADPTGIYLYRGDNYTLDGDDLSIARRHAKIVGLQLRLDLSTEVWAGVIPGKIGDRWKGRMKLGTLRSVARTECTTKASTGI